MSAQTQSSGAARPRDRRTALPGIRLLWPLLASLGAWPALAPSQTPPAAEAQTVLTNAVQVLKLSPTDAEKGQPVRLQGVVTCFDLRSYLFFVQDSTAGIYLFEYKTTGTLKVGQRVAVTGSSAAGRFSPIVTDATVEVRGEGALPKPRAVPIEQLATGSEDCQWVEVEGVVRAASQNWGHLVLDLASGASRLKVRVLESRAGSETNLVAARVKARGVVGSHFNNRRQLTGFHLLVSKLSDIDLLEPAEADPFSAPVQLASSLMNYAHGQTSGRRVRVRGTVTLHWPGRALYIRDKSGGLRIETTQRSLTKPGDVVDVLGFAASNGASPILQDAVFRPVGSEAPPPPAPISVGQALSGEFDKELVQLEAQLVEKERWQTNPLALVLRAENRVFYAYLPPNTEHAALSSLRNGARLRLTGICSVTTGEDLQPTSFSLWLPSAADAQVLEQPAGWLLGRLITIASILAAAALTGLLWVMQLKRRVEQRTEAIRQREALVEERYRDLFENASDIIFTHDLDGNVTSINKAAEQLTGYTREEATKLNIAQIVAPSHRELARQKLNQKLAGATRTTYELEIVSKAGRQLALEVNTHLDYQDGKPLGVRGIARDITQRRQAEEALRQSEQRLRQSLLERERLGRDLHDSIIQSIYAIGLGLEDLRGTLKTTPDQAEARLAQALTGLNGVIRDVRNFIVGLQPEALQGQDLEGVMKSLLLTIGYDPHSHFVFQIDARAAHDLHPDQINSLLHIAREAMSNCLRHSHAKTTCVELCPGANGVHFEVRDDGSGFDANCLGKPGCGLRNIAARAQELQARLEVRSRPGEGACISLEIPKATPHVAP
ncbi:MAG: PAS domain S-box protein [Verrucomicrobia bacterium]|nr:PAS domain S-box protein [Verrucomicrobiota bacterium]